MKLKSGYKKPQARKELKAKKKDRNIGDTVKSMSDDYMELLSVANSVTAKKLSEIVIMNIEILKISFKDIEISAQIFPPLDKVTPTVKINKISLSKMAITYRSVSLSSR
ncbi:unnamed protein product [Rhizophagus irregularis]|nr:unnamed protein product [Rhizophagus irregularis]CAB4443428.1 unnamed protein product [Rhizophagus irregularis]